MTALVVAVLLALVAASAIGQRVYLRWVSGWVGGGQGSDSGAAPVAEMYLTKPIPGRVDGVDESDFSADGYVALVESGLRLTEQPGAGKTTWGAFWHEVTGYAVHRQAGSVHIEVSGSGRVQVDTGRGAVMGQWESVLETHGVPLSDR